MQIIGQMLQTFLCPNAMTSYWEQAMSLTMLDGMQPPPLYYPELLTTTTATGSATTIAETPDCAAELKELVYLEDDIIVRAVHRIHQCFTSIGSLAVESSGTTSPALESSLHQLCLALHSTQWLDVIMYYTLMRRGSSPVHLTGSSSHGQVATHEIYSSSSSCGTKRKSMEDGNGNGDVATLTLPASQNEAIEVLIYSYCPGTYLKPIDGDDQDIGRAHSKCLYGKYFKGIIDIFLNTTDCAADISYHQNLYNNSKQYLTAIQQNAQSQRKISGDMDHNRIKSERNLYSPFLYLLLLRCAILEILLPPPPTPPSSISGSAALFQDLCEYCLLNDQHEPNQTLPVHSQKNQEQQTSSSPTSGPVSPCTSISPIGSSSSLLLISSILNELHIYSLADTFEKFIIGLLHPHEGEGQVATSYSGGECERDDRREKKRRNLFPCRILKSFLSEQLDIADSPFALVIKSVQKCSIDRGVILADTLKVKLEV